MKKYIIELGAIFTAIILMSTVTAVPKSQSDPAMNLINDIEEKINVLEIQNIKDFLNNVNVKTGGIIELLIQLIILIIQFVMELINFISSVISLVTLIQNLIEAVSTLFELFQNLIELIRSIFNPELKIT